MIKAAGELIIPYLHKMFNTTFSSGQYPNSWASAYIKPLLKKGDPKLPENYRGVAINPSIAKLFNLILNKRLDNFLTDRSCIDSCQIEFSKNARTSDYMSVKSVSLINMPHPIETRCIHVLLILKRHSTR